MIIYRRNIFNHKRQKQTFLFNLTSAYLFSRRLFLLFFVQRRTIVCRCKKFCVWLESDRKRLDRVSSNVKVLKEQKVTVLRSFWILDEENILVSVTQPWWLTVWADLDLKTEQISFKSSLFFNEKIYSVYPQHLCKNKDAKFYQARPKLQTWR